MKLLLDTCTLLALGTGNLPKEASKYEAAVPALVAWEIAIKVRTGKLLLPDAPLPWIESLCDAADLPLIHRDPFDRVLIATCLSQNLTILTSNRIIPTYPGVQAIW